MTNLISLLLVVSLSRDMHPPQRRLPKVALPSLLAPNLPGENQVRTPLPTLIARMVKGTRQVKQALIPPSPFLSSLVVL